MMDCRTILSTPKCVEICRNAILYPKLTAMGWENYKRLCKAHVLEIFKVLDYPDGYEHYESIFNS